MSYVKQTAEGLQRLINLHWAGVPDIEAGESLGLTIRDGESDIAEFDLHIGEAKFLVSVQWVGDES